MEFLFEYKVNHFLQFLIHSYHPIYLLRFYLKIHLHSIEIKIKILLSDHDVKFVTNVIF